MPGVRCRRYISKLRNAKIRYSPLCNDVLAPEHRAVLLLTQPQVGAEASKDEPRVLTFQEPWTGGIAFSWSSVNQRTSLPSPIGLIALLGAAAGIEVTFAISLLPAGLVLY